MEALTHTGQTIGNCDHILFSSLGALAVVAGLLLMLIGMIATNLYLRRT